MPPVFNFGRFLDAYFAPGFGALDIAGADVDQLFAGIDQVRIFDLIIHCHHLLGSVREFAGDSVESVAGSHPVLGSLTVISDDEKSEEKRENKKKPVHIASLG
jgi:hypothetical protein